MTDERSPRFEQDLTAVLRQTAGDGAPASLRYRLADVTATPPPERRWWFAPSLRWAAVAMAVMAVAVLAFLMIPHQNVGQTPSSSAQASPSAAPPSGKATSSGEASPTGSPSVSPVPTSVPAPVAWSTLTWPQGVAMGDGQYLSDLVPWGDGYVGVGGVDDGSGFEPAFFSSTDGSHWTMVQRLPATKTDDLAGVLAAHLVRMGNRLLAVGGAVTNGPAGLPAGAAPLWTSVDGTTWTSVVSPTWASASTWPAWLLSGPGGVVAIRSGSDPVVLASADGSTWTRATIPVEERAIAKDAIAWLGGFVIIGRDGQPDSACCAVENTPPPPGVGRPAAWISADGVHWSEATVDGERLAGAELRQVVALDSGLLAVGINSTADFYDVAMTGWTSSDGRTWSIATDGWPLDAGAYPTFAADGQHAIVLGRAPGGSTLAAWATTDGVTWTRLTVASAGNAPPIDCGSHADCVRVDQAWLAPEGVIVLGNSASGEGPQQVWMATPGS